MGRTPYIVTCKYCMSKLRVSDPKQKWHKRCRPKPKVFKYPRIYWEKRHDVIARDKSTCRECQSQKNDIHVHHIDKNIKNNNTENLICLCSICHKQAHIKNKQYKVEKATELKPEQIQLYKPTMLFKNISTK